MAKSHTITSGSHHPQGPAAPEPSCAGSFARSSHRPEQKGNGHTAYLLASGLAALIIAWAVVIFTVEQARFAVLAPRAEVGVEAAAALARLFGALVLFLFPVDKAGHRLRWVAGGFVVLGLGGLVFGYLYPMFGVIQDLNASMYESLVARTVAGVLFVVGLVPATPPQFTRRSMLIALALFGALGIAVAVGADLLPPLVHITSLEAAAALGDTPLRGLTGWHWALSGLPLVLAIAAALGVAHRSRGGTPGGWLLPAMVLLSGSQLHSRFWPWIYSPVLTTADLLRLAFAAVVAVGGILELRHISAERAALLAVELEHSRRLSELAVFKADFTAMVAHELYSPLASIRGLTDMLSTGVLPPVDQERILASIQHEADMLSALVADVQTAATV